MPEETRASLKAQRQAETPNRWITKPATRLWMYSILVALAGLATGYGIITAAQGGLWLSLGAAVLGVGNLLAAANTPKRLREVPDPGEEDPGE